MIFTCAGGTAPASQQAPFVPHAPDDPGPLPPDPDEDGARRRFRLF